MASTRNINSKLDYSVVQKSTKAMRQYYDYEYKNTAYKSAMPELGVNVSHMPRHVMAKNATDVESMLYGIGVSNLVTPFEAPKPQVNKLPTIKYFETPKLIKSKPLVVEADQRPERPM